MAALASSAELLILDEPTSGLDPLMEAAFVLLRIVGDIGDGTVSWFSPIGLAQKARPFAGERLWPLLPLLAAIWLMIGLAVLVYGFAPRWVDLLWAILAASFVIGLLGVVLRVPDWMQKLSPFERTPALPAAEGPSCRLRC